MLQMIIMFIMAGVVVTTGYVSLTQAQVQAHVQDVKTVNQRLDAAVRAVEGSLRKSTGMQEVGVPGAEIDGSGFPTLPASMGVIRETPWGSKFRYCPFAPFNNQSNLSDFQSQTITAGPGETYATTMYKGLVVNDTTGAGIFTSGKGLSGVAFITAATKDGQQAPSCSNIILNQAQATVPGGLARLVQIPRRTFLPNAAEQKAASYYISQNGGGNMSGSDGENTSPIDATIYDILNKRPREVYMFLIGAVTPSKKAWVDLTYSTGWARKIWIEGGSLELPLNQPNTPNTTWEMLGDWIVSSTTIINGRAFVHPASTLTFIGTVNWNPPQDGNTTSTIVTNSGARLSLISANLRLSNRVPNTYGAIINNGYGSMRNSNINVINENGARYNYTLHNLGKFEMEDSNLGGPQGAVAGMRPNFQAIAFSGASARMVMLNTNYVTASVGASIPCWYDFSGAIASNHTRTNAIGSNMSIPAESEFPESSQAESSNTAAYKDAAERRRIARGNVVGPLNCV